MKNRRLSSILLGSSLIVFTASAYAGDVIKANNTISLNVAGAPPTGSWVAGVVPASTDVAVWDSTVAAPNVSALGGDLSWQGIKVSNVAGTANPSATTAGIQITNASSANTLTLGTSGIDMSAATQALQIQSKIELSGSQTWSVANANTNGNPFAGTINAGVGEDLLFNAQVAPTAMNLGGFTLGTSGLGTIVITNGYTLSNGNLNFGNTNTWIQSGSSRATTLLNTLAVTVGTNANLRLRANSGGVSSAAAIGVSGTGAKLQLEINNSGVTMAQSGALTFGTGTTFENILSSAGGMTIGAISATGNVAWNVNGGAAAMSNGVAVSGALTGSGTITYANTATNAIPNNNQVRLSGDNSAFNGTFNINGASGNRSLRLTSANAGSALATWAPAANNILQVDGVAVNLGTLNGAGTVTNSHATNVATISVGAGAFSGIISNGTPTDGMALTKTGIGTLALTGANSYTGLTDIQGGTLTTTTAETGTGAVTVANSATFGVNQLSNEATFNVSTLTMGSTGSSTLELTPAAAPSAALVTAGTFTVNGPTTLRVKGLPVAGTTLVSYTSTNLIGISGLNLVMPFRIGGTLNNTGSAITLATVTDETPKWRNGNGVWDTNPTGNWKTTTTSTTTNYLEGGVGATDSVIFDDTSSGTSPITVTLNATVSPVAITVAGTKDYIISGSGTIAGTTGITKNGSAALTLATANTFSGSVLLNGGTLNINNATALGSGTLTIAGGTVVNNTSGSPVVATNAQNWNGDFTFTGSNDLTLGAATMNADRLVTVSANTLSVGAVTGGFGLTKAGAGTLAVGAGSSYSGATAINAGVLKAAAASAFSASSSVTLANSAGTALDLNGFNQTVNTITGGGATGGDILLNGGVLTTGTAGDNTFAGDLVGAGGLTKQGAGRLILTGDKTGYTGITNVNAGNLDLDTINGNFGAPVTVTGGVANNSIIVGSGLFVQGNGTLNTGISGGGAGFGARGGDLTVNVGGSGATIIRNSGGSAGLGQMIFGSATSDSKVIVQNSVDLNNFNGSRDITVNTGTGTASAEVSGVIFATFSIANIIKKGTGDLILSAANTYSGETAIDAGRIVLRNNLALQNSPINTDNVGKIDATGFTTPTFGGLKGTADLSTMFTGGYSGITTLTLNTVNTNAALLATVPPKTLTTFNGVISNGAPGMNLVKSGVGTQTLNGANTYTGSTTISGGTLKLGTTGSLAAATNISIAAGGTFDLTDLTLSSGTYTWNAASLSASGTAAPATIAGTAGGNVDLGIKPITLTHDGTNAPLTVSGSGLSLAGNQFTVVVPGPALTAGVYTLVSGVAITGTVNPTPSYMGGSGVDSGLSGVVSISGNTVILTVAPGSGFGTWITGFGLAVSDQDPSDDPDNDGISNLVEYAIAGQDPTVGNTSIGTFVAKTLSFTKRLPLATDLTYAIEVSTDLGATPWVEAAGLNFVNDSTTISYLLPGAPAKNFMRLKVTKTP